MKNTNNSKCYGLRSYFLTNIRNLAVLGKETDPRCLKNIKSSIIENMMDTTKFLTNRNAMCADAFLTIALLMSCAAEVFSGFVRIVLSCRTPKRLTLR